VDIDECQNPNICGPGAICTNLDGSYICSCPDGFEGFDPQTTGCIDINECTRSPCGRNEDCLNEVGSYKCVPIKNINECLNNPCGANAICTDTIGSYVCSCKPDYTGDPNKGCIDIDECRALEQPCGNFAICENASPGYNCKCLQGYRAVPNAKNACEQADVNVLCQSNFDCTNNAECVDGQCFCQEGFEASGNVCVDINECLDPKICGPRATCHNILGGYKCECDAGLIGTPPRLPCKEPCIDVECGPHAYCQTEENEAFCICEKGWTFLPQDISKGCVDINECDSSHGPFGMCGTNAICNNVDGGYDCSCPEGFSGDPHNQCFDVDECKHSQCGENAICINEAGGYRCECPQDMIADPDPTIRCIAVVTCETKEDCPGNAICDAHKRCLCPEPNIGNDCRHPCEDLNCGPNAKCSLVRGLAKCLCAEGFILQGGACIDKDECSPRNPCGRGAICINYLGGYTCQCGNGMSGDPYKGECKESNALVQCSAKKPCPSGEKCVANAGGSNVCVCTQGHTRDSVSKQCRDIDECVENHKPACGLNALCKNLPGSYECVCAEGYYGNPYEICEICDTPDCQCQPPYTLVGKNCILAGCSKDQKCPPGAECISITGGLSYCACPKGFRTQTDGSCVDIDECRENPQACGFDAICTNNLGGYTCECPLGYDGDPFDLCSPAQRRCVSDKECGSNEKCVQPGECICPPPFFVDSGNVCRSPCERFACGINAKCTPTDPPQCMCEAGFKGDPLLGCVSVDECANAPCAYGAQCFNQKGGNIHLAYFFY
jgi:Calcium-binding EGF domain/EGF domain